MLYQRPHPWQYQGDKVPLLLKCFANSYPGKKKLHYSEVGYQRYIQKYSNSLLSIVTVGISIEREIP